MNVLRKWPLMRGRDSLRRPVLTDWMLQTFTGTLT